LQKRGFRASLDSLVVAGSFVLRINICGENPPHRQAENRYGSFKKTTLRTMKRLKLISSFIILTFLNSCRLNDITANKNVSDICKIHQCKMTKCIVRIKNGRPSASFFDKLPDEYCINAKCVELGGCIIRHKQAKFARKYHCKICDKIYRKKKANKIYKSLNNNQEKLKRI
jgi:hypothetical protein